jgi:hypothetical protein
MTAVFSTTADDRYLFFLPIAVWSWNQIGVRCLIFCPSSIKDNPKFRLAQNYCRVDTQFVFFDCGPDAEATYAQVSRLFAAAIPELPQDEIVITSDIDMMVFGDYLKQSSGYIDIFGADLLQGTEQYPMCYISMSVAQWWYVMQIGNRSLQECLDLALGHEAVNKDMRGNLWARDQELVFRMIQKSGLTVTEYPRRNAAGFAKNRIDRDDAHCIASAHDAIDFHLFRPGYTDENWRKIVEVLCRRFLPDKMEWIAIYRNEYIKLL